MVERIGKMIEDTTRTVLKNPLLLGSLMVAMVVLKVRFGAEEDPDSED